ERLSDRHDERVLVLAQRVLIHDPETASSMTSGARAMPARKSGPSRATAPARSLRAESSEELPHRRSDDITRLEQDRVAGVRNLQPADAGNGVPEGFEVSARSEDIARGRDDEHGHVH